MKDEILTKLYSVINALSSVETHGKQSLLQLGGSINALEEAYGAIKSGLIDKPTEAAPSETK